MTVDFSVTTSSPGGTYAPRNIGAIWIEDEDGQFLQTLKRWANNRRQYLYTWNNRSGGNVVDGITGATRSSHGTHTVSWDFTNFSGDTLERGDYVLWIEMTDRHSQGPLFSFTFPFMGAPEVIIPPEQNFFHNMQLTYDLDILVGVDADHSGLPETQTLLQNYPNPFNPGTWISFILGTPRSVELTIFNIQGQPVRELKHGHQPTGTHSVYWDGRNEKGEKVTAGVYLCKLTTKDQVYAIKMTLLN